MGQPDQMTALPMVLGSSGRPEPGDDFYCLRYRVWYPSLDCAIRTRFRTSPGCLECQQGRFNLKRHAEDLRGNRLLAIYGG